MLLFDDRVACWYDGGLEAVSAGDGVGGGRLAFDDGDFLAGDVRIEALLHDVQEVSAGLRAAAVHVGTEEGVDFRAACADVEHNDGNVRLGGFRRDGAHGFRAAGRDEQGIDALCDEGGDACDHFRGVAFLVMRRKQFDAKGFALFADGGVHRDEERVGHVVNGPSEDEFAVIGGFGATAVDAEADRRDDKQRDDGGSRILQPLGVRGLAGREEADRVEGEREDENASTEDAIDVVADSVGI